MEKIKYIDLVCENLEVLRLQPKTFNYLNIGEINKQICVNCYQYKNGEKIEHITCNYFYIQILKNAYEIKSNAFTIGFYEKKLYEILKNNNLTHIQLFYKDGTNECIALPFGEEEYYNTKQTTKYLNNCIEIEIKDN